MHQPRAFSTRPAVAPSRSHSFTTEQSRPSPLTSSSGPAPLFHRQPTAPQRLSTIFPPSTTNNHTTNTTSTTNNNTRRIDQQTNTAWKASAASRRRAALRLQKERLQEDPKNHFDDSLWPGNACGDDCCFHAYKETQQTSTASYQAPASPHPHSPIHIGRGFDDQDPDDCWGYGCQFSYSSSCSQSEPDKDENKDEVDNENEKWFGSNDWEEFKKNWYRHSQEHHHRWYYAYEDDGQTDNGYQQKQQQYATIPLKDEAVKAATRALETVERVIHTTTSSKEEEEAIKKEIEELVLSSAGHSGHDVIVFASAWGIQVDEEGGAQGHVEKAARRKLLLRYHPDRLQSASAMQQWLGTCVVQTLTTVVA